MNFEKAVQFIRDNGNEVEQARLNYILTNELPAEAIIAKFFAHQRHDGGSAPFWADNYSSLDATCFRLAQSKQLGITGSESRVVRALNFLSQRQSIDGSWERMKMWPIQPHLGQRLAIYLPNSI